MALDSAVKLVLFALCYVPMVISQQPTTPAAPVAQPSDSCNGVFLSYASSPGTRLPPNVSDATQQPYSFNSTLTVLNHDLNGLKSWRVFVGFQHKEILVSASNAVLTDGTSLPARVEKGAIFAGFPTSDLKSAIETAGDPTQIQVQVKLVGTEFGLPPPRVPLPSNISLANDGWLCPTPTMSVGNNEMHVCCLKDEKFVSNITVDDNLLSRQNGDLTIMYDVTSTDESNYFAQVTIENHNPLGRLDNWQLSWNWMRDEFIYSMKGASTSVKDSSDCIFGRQNSFYQKLDFSQVLNCDRMPTIIDLPPTLANDTNFGRIPSCCRNGTILPPIMDPSKSTSRFQMQVFKMPPDLNRSTLTPPQNWRINGTTMNPDYICGPPVRVSPSQFPDPTGLPVNATAIASWQVICNISQSKAETPKCCVSFSAFYNDSVIPCNTCACGCPQNTAQTCSATTPAMLLPPAALLVPFDNRTAMAVSWNEDTKHIPVPKPMPCGDNCGVSINWHVLSDFRNGWTARITLFNWGKTNFADWFAAVELDKAAVGFEGVHSFNGSTLQSVNNTIFMQGRPGLNFLVAETDGPNPLRDPRVPGKQQSVISFTKKNTAGIKVVSGDGFPTKVFFNGEECSLPSIYPSSGSGRDSSALVLSVVLTLLVFIFMHH